jgi:hypothetical protein
MKSSAAAMVAPKEEEEERRGRGMDRRYTNGGL